MYRSPGCVKVDRNRPRRMVRNVPKQANGMVPNGNDCHIWTFRRTLGHSIGAMNGEHGVADDGSGCFPLVSLSLSLSLSQLLAISLPLYMCTALITRYAGVPALPTPAPLLPFPSFFHHCPILIRKDSRRPLIVRGIMSMFNIVVVDVDRPKG